jgi:UDP-N-acetyl-D-galactosamine dehydrogenase
MGSYVAEQLIKSIQEKDIKLSDSRVLVMGLTFKENCPDLRNTKVVDVVNKLNDSGLNVDVWDPWVNLEEAENEYDILPIKAPEEGVYDGIILAVAHEEFVKMGEEEIRKFGTEKHVLYDLKYILSSEESDLRL